MQVIENDYSVFMTNVQNATNLGLGTDSTKRLIHYCDRQFGSPKLDKDKPIFDDQARDVLMKYAFRPEEWTEEIGYLDSIGFGGVKDSSQLLDQIKKFQGPHAPSFQWNENYKLAIKQVSELVTPKWAMLDILEYGSEKDFKDALPKTDSHSGFEFIVTGFKYKGEYLGIAKDHFKSELEEARRRGSFGKPILTLNRLQCSGAYDPTDNWSRTGSCKHKTRLVSAVDIWVIFAELMFAKRVQQHFGRLKQYAGGKKPNDLRANIMDWRINHKFWTSLDYSKYDQSIPDWVIRDAFSIIWGMFNPNVKEKWRWLYNIVVNDFIDKTFIGPDGALMHANHGVPSGSMFTQIIDSLVNLIMIHTYINSLNRKRTRDIKFECIICGDDNLIFTNEELDLDDLAGYLRRNFGIEMHPDKCEKGNRDQSPQFLSRQWRWSGEWRHPKELVAKMLYPERFRPYKLNPQLSPEAIVYSYILAYPEGMKEVMDVNRFLKDNTTYLRSWSIATFQYQSGYLSYLMRYENSL